MSKITFTRAQRKRAKLRLAISGVAGSGKTTAALEIATGLLGKSGGRIAVCDTEKGSASLYSTSYVYDTMELNPPYAPERFIEVIHAAEEAGYDVLIIDSASPEWNGSGGCTEINEELAQAKYRGNTWSAWSQTTPRHRAFIDAILQSNLHVIATFRAKEETVQGEDKKVRKVGMKAEARDGTSFEFSVVFELEHQTHAAIVTKDRTRLFGDAPHKVTAKTGEMLMEWLNAGVEEKVSPSELDGYLDAIAEAPTMDALREVFGTSYNAAKNIGDKDAMNAITAAKDMRKEALSKPDPRGDEEADTATVDKHFAAIVDILNEDIEEQPMAVKLAAYADEHLSGHEALYIGVLDKLAGGKQCPRAGWQKFMTMARAAKQEKAA